ncbi:antitoxin [Mumia zhuanghuii]|uniref:Antitoxin n=1 Tax=Mumia zhuanghuii TaxID=2585211 RepID=A0A5C4M374_9ACTN|nr:antitoxin [Mumia zhuanghuii]TNC26836.1 antitoxin [Mumia zhuanghuii]
MGLLDKFTKNAHLRGKAKNLLNEHGDKIDKGIDKAADLARGKAGSKHGDKIDKGADALKDGLDKLDRDPTDRRRPGDPRP